MIPRIRLHPVHAALAVAVLAAIGAAIVPIATPVQAQSSLTHDSFDDDDDQPCMTSHRLRDFVAGKGYVNVKLYSSSEPWYVHAIKGSSVYKLTVATCRGAIVGQQRIGTM